MALAKGDVLDENKKSPSSCRMAVEVLDGGAGFQKINCCSNELTELDKVPKFDSTIERFERDDVKAGVVFDESKNHPNSCGLKVKVLGGGAGFKSINCCGNELTVADIA